MPGEQQRRHAHPREAAWSARAATLGRTGKRPVPCFIKGEKSARRLPHNHCSGVYGYAEAEEEEIAMKRTLITAGALLITAAAVLPASRHALAQAAQGWTSLFDGKSVDAHWN